MSDLIMRVRFKELGGHTHVQVFTGRRGCTLGKCGDLTLTNDEFQKWKENTLPLEFVNDAIQKSF